MKVIARSLAVIETDIPATPAQVTSAQIEAAAFRDRHGLPALIADDERPEEEFYRRARALGFRRLGR